MVVPSADWDSNSILLLFLGLGNVNAILCVFFRCNLQGGVGRGHEADAWRTSRFTRVLAQNGNSETHRDPFAVGHAIKKAAAKEACTYLIC